MGKQQKPKSNERKVRSSKPQKDVLKRPSGMSKVDWRFLGPVIAEEIRLRNK